MGNPKVAVLVLCTNEKEFLKDVLTSLSKQTYKNLTVYVLDNNSNDGSLDKTQKSKLKSQNQKSKFKIIRFKENLGYAKGNNYGLNLAFEKGADLCLVLNCDTILKKNTIEELVNSYQKKVSQRIKVGLIQPVVLLANDKQKINSVGNAIHYLGFGYCQDYLRRYKPVSEDKEIVSVSGAAMLISKDYFLQVGSFDEDFFMTSEDEDLSWRGLLFGYRHFLASKSVIYHHYQFGRHQLNKYREEKNRLMILLKNYSSKTLLILSPILLVNETAMAVYSLIEGWFLLKMKTYWFILSHLKSILKKRYIIQEKRAIEDKILLIRFKSTINFPPVNNLLIKYLANPLYYIYYQAIRLLIHS